MKFSNLDHFWESSNHYHLVGGFNPCEKYESQLGLLFPIYGKIKNVPNHQPVIHYSLLSMIIILLLVTQLCPCYSGHLDNNG
jgi:hypothetical protein